MRSIVKIAGGCFVTFFLLTMMGCVTKSTDAPARSPLTDADLRNPWTGQIDSPAPNKPERIEQALGSDACSIQLGDIEGALVLWYATRHQLPARLEDLRTENGEALPINCPASGHPYQYFPEGLASPGRQMRIIVCDDAPVHNGFRWCIFVMPGKSGELALDVKPVPEGMFRTYLPAAP